MSKQLIIHGNNELFGELRPSGNKNAALPMLCASLLTNEEVKFNNVPDIIDIEKMLAYFSSAGTWVDWNKAARTITLDHSRFCHMKAKHFPTEMRSTVMLLAPVLERCGRIEINTQMTGCALGAREIDPHLMHLVEHGAELSNDQTLELKLDGPFEATDSWPEYASVTGTTTFLLSSVKANGESSLKNSAFEPHVMSVRRMLTDMGAKIHDSDGALIVQGVDRLNGGEFRVPDDHHEVATFIAIGAAAGGRIKIHTQQLNEMSLIFQQLRKLGVDLEIGNESVTVRGWSRKVQQPLTSNVLPKIEAAPWPYFPADLLPQLIGLSIGCTSEVLFWNKVYEGALGWVSELSKFGARATLCDPHRVIVSPSRKLEPAIVESPYIIRVAVGLVIAALQIDGKSTIRNADPIWRAHPNFVEKLQSVGAKIEIEETD